MQHNELQIGNVPVRRTASLICMQFLLGVVGTLADRLDTRALLGHIVAQTGFEP
jgi:hypothetical protein